MSQIVRLAFALVLIVVAGPARAQDGQGGYEEMVLGNPDAPVTIVEYSSLTCPHCASFHRDTLPRIKKEWIDTGKAKLVFRDFPFDAIALGAAMLVRCADDNRRFALLDILFQTQSRWATSPNPLEALRATTKLAGMQDATFDACLDNNALMREIQARQDEAQKKFGINSTPTFIIDGEKVAGAQPYEVFAEVLGRKGR